MDQVQRDAVNRGILNRFVEHVNEITKQNLNHKKECENSIKELEKYKGKIIKKDKNEDNYFDMAVDCKINEIKDGLSGANFILSRNQYLLEHIEGYKEIFPKKTYSVDDLFFNVENQTLFEKYKEEFPKTVRKPRKKKENEETKVN